MSAKHLWTGTSGTELTLVERDGDIAIRIGDRTLMSSDVHDSEDELGRITASLVAHLTQPRVLIGGLGLGFTLRTTLDGLPPKAKVDVAELMPQVVAWNRAEHGVHAGRPLDDPRVKLHVKDVAKVIAGAKARYDVISLDVDNGPSAITQPENEQLYRRAGLLRTKAALRPGGVLAVWSSFPSRTFTKSLEVVGTVKLVRTTPAFKGAPRYYIWLATKPGEPRRR